MKKTTTKKAPKKSVKKSVKKSIFSSVKNLANSALLNLIRTESVRLGRIVYINELADIVTAQGNPQTNVQIRKKLQRVRKPYFKQGEADSMRGNGQVQLPNGEILGWRKEEGKEIGYGIEKGSL